MHDAFTHNYTITSAFTRTSGGTIFSYGVSVVMLAIREINSSVARTARQKKNTHTPQPDKAPISLHVVTGPLAF